MDNLLNFIWLVPAALILFFVYRLIKTKEVNNGSLSGNKRGSTNWIYFIVIILVITGIGFLYFSKDKSNSIKKTISEVKCPTVISADEFAAMDLSNENDIASYFYDKGFTRDRFVLDKGTDNERTVIDYVLHDEGWYTNLGRYALVRERGALVVNSTYWGKHLFYELNNREKFEKFFEYLISLGADTVRPNKFSNYTGLANNYSSFSYRRKIYVKEGFESERQQYKIRIFDYSNFVPINNADTIQKEK